jgi:anti-sigma factor RsiW
MSTCPQSNLIEALHDGRLGPTEAASCERHLRTCPECAARQRHLAAVREAVRAPVDPPTPLAHQRARNALLRAAVAEPHAPPRHRRLALVAGVFFAASALAGVSLWRAGAPPAPLPELPAPPVAPSEAPKESRPVHAASNAPASAALPSSLPAPRVVAPPKPRRVASRPAVAPPTTAPASAPEAPPRASPASRDFAAAMDALAAGDFGVAATRFVDFTAKYPGDPRSDEAAYLVAITLQRAGQTENARTAAQRYLRDRPDGAHRTQAAKIAGAEDR